MQELVKLYITIDDKGVDGFGFSSEDREFRRLRAASNHWRGMRFVEIEITKNDLDKFLAMFKLKMFAEAKLFIDAMGVKYDN